MFENVDADAPPIVVLLQSGESGEGMRQSELVQQLLQVMDRMWLAKGIDMRMMPFKQIILVQYYTNATLATTFFL